MCRAICVCCIVLQFAIVQFYNVQRLCASVRNAYFIMFVWAKWVQSSTVCVVRFVFVQFARDALQDCAMYMFKMFVQFVF